MFLKSLLILQFPERYKLKLLGILQLINEFLTNVVRGERTGDYLAGAHDFKCYFHDVRLLCPQIFREKLRFSLFNLFCTICDSCRFSPGDKVHISFIRDKSLPIISFIKNYALAFHLS